MKFSKSNEEDVEFIENWYNNIELGFKALGKVYKRPDDYIERALRIMNESAQRNRLCSQFEGKRGFFHEET